MKIAFYGVRGSCPCPGASTRRYGGNTACVLVEADDEAPIILDLGTGVRHLAEELAVDGVLQATALVSHVHLDHIQGLPFLPMLDRPGSRLDIYGPGDGDRSLAEVLDGLVGPPYFPVLLAERPATVRCHDVESGHISIGSAQVTVRPVRHTGPTVGYRIEWGGSVVAYVTDHQAPRDLEALDADVLALAQGADLLIHDAQYSSAEFQGKCTWGHSTPAYAVRVAVAAGARRLALFHHDPAHDDDELDHLLADARDAAPTGLEVVSAREGLSLWL